MKVKKLLLTKKGWKSRELVRARCRNHSWIREQTLPYNIFNKSALDFAGHKSYGHFTILNFSFSFSKFFVAQDNCRSILEPIPLTVCAYIFYFKRWLFSGNTTYIWYLTHRLWVSLRIVNFVTFLSRSHHLWASLRTVYFLSRT